MRADDIKTTAIQFENKWNTYINIYTEKQRIHTISWRIDSYMPNSSRSQFTKIEIKTRRHGTQKNVYVHITWTNAKCKTTHNTQHTTQRGNHNDTFNENGFSILFILHFSHSSIFSLLALNHFDALQNMPASFLVHLVDGLFLVTCYPISFLFSFTTINLFQMKNDTKMWKKNMIWTLLHS